MLKTDVNSPRHPAKHEPADEPDAMPVEPDEGPVPAFLPADPEEQRVVLPVL